MNTQDQSNATSVALEQGWPTSVVHEWERYLKRIHGPRWSTRFIDAQVRTSIDTEVDLSIRAYIQRAYGL